MKKKNPQPAGSVYLSEAERETTTPTFTSFTCLHWIICHSAFMSEKENRYRNSVCIGIIKIESKQCDVYLYLWNPLYLIISQATKTELERGQFRKGAWKRGKQALREARFSKFNWKLGRIEILLWRTLTIQCFCQAKDNIQ